MLNKKDKNVMETLMAFYQIMVEIYAQSTVRFKDPIIAGLMVRAHLFELINFHKKKTEDDEIPIPKTTEIYKKYIQEWNVRIRTKEKDLEQIVKDYKEKNKGCSYIS